MPLTDNAPRSQAPEYSCTVFAAGNSQVQGEAALLAQTLEELLPPYDKNLPKPLRVSGAITNNWTSLVVLGVTFFVTKRIGEKFLDDVYAQVQPRIKAWLEKIDQKLTGGNRTAEKVLTVSVWYADYNVLISISVIGKDFDEVLQQLHLIPVVHANALNWCAAHEAGKPIHHYKIENGKVNAAPELLDHFSEILR